jgi:hypothetical protein
MLRIGSKATVLRLAIADEQRATIAVPRPWIARLACETVAETLQTVVAKYKLAFGWEVGNRNSDKRGLYFVARIDPCIFQRLLFAGLLRRRC